MFYDNLLLTKAKMRCYIFRSVTRKSQKFKHAKQHIHAKTNSYSLNNSEAQVFSSFLWICSVEYGSKHITREEFKE